MTKPTQAICELCGEPMPPGEEVFKYHGYSCNCPKPVVDKSGDLYATSGGNSTKVATQAQIEALRVALTRWVPARDHAAAFADLVADFSAAAEVGERDKYLKTITGEYEKDAQVEERRQAFYDQVGTGAAAQVSAKYPEAGWRELAKAALTAAAENGVHPAYPEYLKSEIARLEMALEEAEAATIERCAQVAEEFAYDTDHESIAGRVCREIVLEIRKLKDKP